MTEENKKDDGGPAFPTDCTTEDGNLGACFSRGQTLRDYFAGQALCHRYTKNENIELVAQFAYDLADAMLEARKK